MDDMERNRTALVTGGVRGIGLAVASALASRRMRVALAYVGSPGGYCAGRRGAR